MRTVANRISVRANIRPPRNRERPHRHCQPALHLKVPEHEGGESVSPEKCSFSPDHKLASEAARKGGHKSGGNLERAAEAEQKDGHASHGRR